MFRPHTKIPTYHDYFQQVSSTVMGITDLALKKLEIETRKSKYSLLPSRARYLFFTSNAKNPHLQNARLVLQTRHIQSFKKDYRNSTCL